MFCSPCPPVVWSLLDFESWFPLVQVGDASVLSRGRSFFPAVDDLAATQTTIGARMRSNRWNRGGAPRLVAGREELGDLASLFCCLLSPTCRLHADHTVTLGALNVFFFFCAPVEGRHQLAAMRFAFMSPLPDYMKCDFILQSQRGLFVAPCPFSLVPLSNAPRAYLARHRAAPKFPACSALPPVHPREIKSGHPSRDLLP